MAKEHEKYKDLNKQTEIINFANQVTQMHNTMNTNDPTRPSLGLVNNNSEVGSPGITNIQTI